MYFEREFRKKNLDMNNYMDAGTGKTWPVCRPEQTEWPYRSLALISKKALLSNMGMA